MLLSAPLIITAPTFYDDFQVHLQIPHFRINEKKKPFELFTFRETKKIRGGGRKKKGRKRKKKNT